MAKVLQASLDQCVKRIFFEPINDAEEMTAPKSLKFCMGLHYHLIFWVTIALRAETVIMGDSSKFLWCTFIFLLCRRG